MSFVNLEIRNNNKSNKLIPLYHKVDKTTHGYHKIEYKLNNDGYNDRNHGYIIQNGEKFFQQIDFVVI